MLPTIDWAFEKERFILCEGEHDKYILEALIRERGLPDFQVRHSAESSKEGGGGWTGFGPAIKGFKPIIGFSALKGIAIVTDNDNSRTSSSLIKHLRKHGYDPAPSQYVGNIHGKPTVIILIPGEKTYGNLETVCLPALYSVWPGSKGAWSSFLSAPVRTTGPRAIGSIRPGSVPSFPDTMQMIRTKVFIIFFKIRPYQHYISVLMD